MVRKTKSGTILTPLELKIMQVLWTIGPATVSDVQSGLEGDLAHTTVQTMMTVLLRKKKVKRSTAGRAHVYQPLVSRERAVTGALKDFISRTFAGSAEKVLLTMVDARLITAEEIERAAQRLSEHKTGRDK
jgi:BlaI family transcriptional regulator, penicillinase repressor